MQPLTIGMARSIVVIWNLIVENLQGRVALHIIADGQILLFSSIHHGQGEGRVMGGELLCRLFILWSKPLAVATPVDIQCTVRELSAGHE